MGSRVSQREGVRRASTGARQRSGDGEGKLTSRGRGKSGQDRRPGPPSSTAAAARYRLGESCMANIPAGATSATQRFPWHVVGRTWAARADHRSDNVAGSRRSGCRRETRHRVDEPAHVGVDPVVRGWRRSGRHPTHLPGAVGQARRKAKGSLGARRAVNRGSMSTGDR